METSVTLCSSVPSVVDLFVMHYQMLGKTIIDSGIEDNRCIDESRLVIST
ncbi:MAG: hypothetical protein GQ533_01665 [Methanosarcinaceae archaeon]|nr:hypothetical protein [Methanosarcinaceae archaeon]